MINVIQNSNHLIQLSGVIILISSLIILLVSWYFRANKPNKKNEVKILSNIVLSILAALSIYLTYGPTIHQFIFSSEPPIRLWNSFHYYINSKYFTELGYTNLYNCAFLADQESDSPYWNDSTPIRNLTNYEIAKASETNPCPKNEFTQERWESFETDLHSVLGRNDTFLIDQVLTDKGYNATPFWNIFGSLVANKIELDSPLVPIIFNTDIILLFCSFAIAGYAFGYQTTSLLVITSMLFFGTYNRLLGNFFQNTWLSFTLLGISFWKIKRYWVSGLGLFVATMLRIFPVFLISGFIAQTI